MIRSVYQFHVYYHIRRILKRLQAPLPHETGFNATDNPYTESEFFQICEDYRVPNDPMKYRDEKFCWTYQRDIGWPDDYIGPDSMTWWIIEKSVGFTDVGLLKISECQGLCIFNFKFSGLCYVWNSWQHSKCSHSSISFFE